MDIKYKLIRSDRKTVAITIDKNAGLVVKAPLKTPSSVIEEIVRGKSGWIEKTLLTAETSLIKQKNFSLRENGVYYFGEKYGLKLCSGAGTVLFDGRSFYAPNLPDDKLKVTSKNHLKSGFEAPKSKIKPEHSYIWVML